jgi:hypothetical protein
MLDDEENAVTKMTLDDNDIIKFAVQLLRAIYPTIDAARIKAIGMMQ